jgi:hypothetical protein
MGKACQRQTLDTVADGRAPGSLVSGRTMWVLASHFVEVRMIAALLYRTIRSWLPCEQYSLGYEIGRRLANARQGRFLVDGASDGYRITSAVVAGADWRPGGKLVSIKGGKGRPS